MLQGLLLGFSSAVCLVSCTPMILPSLLNKDKSVRNNSTYLVLFLIGRFSGYLGFGILIWSIRHFLCNGLITGIRFTEFSEVILGFTLIVYIFFRNKRKCELQRSADLLKNRFFKNILYFPVFLGLISGISLSPPFLLASIEMSNYSSLAQGLLFFSAFAIGASACFIPVPFIALSTRNRNWMLLVETTFYLIAGYYIVKGLISLCINIERIIYYGGHL